MYNEIMDPSPSVQQIQGLPEMINSGGIVQPNIPFITPPSDENLKIYYKINMLSEKYGVKNDQGNLKDEASPSVESTGSAKH